MNFKQGQRVIANVNDQGLRAGQAYEITSADVYRTFFGSFVTYGLRDREGTVRTVRNGHLVLRPVQDSDNLG